MMKDKDGFGLVACSLRFIGAVVEPLFPGQEKWIVSCA